MMQVDELPWMEALERYQKEQKLAKDLKMDIDVNEDCKVISSNDNSLSSPIVNYYISAPIISEAVKSNQNTDPSLSIPMKDNNRKSPTILTMIGLLWFISFGFITVSFLYHFYQQVHFKLQQRSSNINSMIASCAKSYVLNNCDTIGTTVPHMISVCNEWNDCLNQNPEYIDRLSVLGEAFSSLLNSMIDPLSWKTVTVFTTWSILLLSLIFYFLF